MRYCSLYATSRGMGAVIANERGLESVILPDPAGTDPLLAPVAGDLAALPSSTLSCQGAELLRRYFAGEKVSFALPLDDSHWSTFGRAVYRAVVEIPWGEVRSYGEIARACGRPGAARAVGRLMAANRLPIIIPCHRVVAANGGLTGYSAPGGVAFKRELLSFEAVSVMALKGGAAEQAI